ncbi:hypothetical protein OEZ60_16730 [Defluviimonas sp. WL0024]|uniref:DUF4239 domain-containing protein n=2 Tax=Albidovulum TaxID=205889 RepID=A0ABT3J6C8_9RHOB|nr:MULTISPECIES: hypothetical protein [Defluviimonas]MCU9849647.1 hypothetical protein [Defluviimonas sp. WL0024]MCW3783243.1 hypothetical protein [Defluviimonas salinarum]
MSFIIDNQLLLLLACFGAGLAAVLPLFRYGAEARAWKIADLIWVLLGGVGALAAVLAEVYTADSSKLDRQIDIAYATTRAFDRDAARFRLVHCEGDRHPGPFQPHVRALCNKVEFLSASTAENRGLPLFLEVTQTTVPLSALRFLFGDPGDAESPVGMSQDAMRAEAEQFDPATFLAFAAQDETTQAALKALDGNPDLITIGAEYRVIASAYEELIDQLRRLKAEWEFLQENSQILTLQVIALCLVAFAAPFRLGRSVAALV